MLSYEDCKKKLDEKNSQEKKSDSTHQPINFDHVEDKIDQIIQGGDIKKPSEQPPPKYPEFNLNEKPIAEARIQLEKKPVFPVFEDADRKKQLYIGDSRKEELFEISNPSKKDNKENNIKKKLSIDLHLKDKKDSDHSSNNQINNASFENNYNQERKNPVKNLFNFKFNFLHKTNAEKDELEPTVKINTNQVTEIQRFH